ESLIFIFIGLELPVVVRGLSTEARWTLVGASVVISVVCIVVRLAWVFPSARITRRVDLKTPEIARRVWRQVAFVGWAGMRGADSLVIALALPLMTRLGTPFPARASIIVITFGVILFTLVVQGFTLATAARWLRLTGPSAREDALEEAKAWIATADAALEELERVANAASAQSRTARRAIARLIELHRRRRREWQRRAEAGNAAPGERLDAERHLELALVAREREAVLTLRDRGEIDDVVSRHVERYLDLETLLLNYPDLDVSDSPFDPGE
ncbi:MAG TPA: cation:proton antiporter, partial [Gemmatimonadaceae bacterium]|nr:cation:proton antiporter [Gemmatimonadaceae bacterium]